MTPWRRNLLHLVALGVVFLGAGRSHAGLYNLSEPEEFRLFNSPRYDDDGLRGLQALLAQLRSIAADNVEFNPSLRKRYFLAADLARHSKFDALTEEQKVDLSAIFIRRGNPVAAWELLEPLARKDSDNPLVHANLAMAYFRAGELGRARDTQRLMLRNLWPELPDEATEQQREFYERMAVSRLAETYFLKLLQARLREKGKPADAVDPIFEAGNPPRPIRFVDAQGEFTPGRIDADQKNQLHSNAVDVVQTLLIWMPNDARLYWLLGELYNAQGTPDSARLAHVVFTDLVGEGWKFRSEEVLKRQRALESYVAALPPRELDTAKSKSIENYLKSEDPPASAVDWRSLLVGFGTGFILAFFVIWQAKEFKRRARAR